MIKEKMTMTKTQNMPTFSKPEVEYAVDKKKKGRDRDKIVRTSLKKQVMAGKTVREIALGEGYDIGDTVSVPGLSGVKGEVIEFDKITGTVIVYTDNDGNRKTVTVQDFELPTDDEEFLFGDG